MDAIINAITSQVFSGMLNHSISTTRNLNINVPSINSVYKFLAPDITVQKNVFLYTPSALCHTNFLLPRVGNLNISIDYKFKYLNLRFNTKIKTTRYQSKVVNLLGNYQSGRYYFKVGESQEIPLLIESTDGTNFKVSGTYEYINSKGLVERTGSLFVNDKTVFVLINFDHPGMYRLKYRWICTPVDINGNIDTSKNAETGVSEVSIVVEP